MSRTNNMCEPQPFFCGDKVQCGDATKYTNAHYTGIVPISPTYNYTTAEPERSSGSAMHCPTVEWAQQMIPGVNHGSRVRRSYC